MNAVFGYGSLILPQSLIARYKKNIREEAKNYVEKTDKERSQAFLHFYTEKLERNRWENHSLKIIPVKVKGYKRYYELEIGNSNMLTIRKDKENYVNGVIASNLTKDQLEKISETEKAYKEITVPREKIESYLSEEEMKQRNLEIPEKVTTYIADPSHEKINHNTQQKRNQNYHRYMEKGIKEVLNPLFPENNKRKNEIREKFLTDLEKTTYEKYNGKWTKINEIK